jgi:integrase
MKIAIILDQYLQEYAENNICSVLRTRSCVKNLTLHLGKHDHARLTERVLRSYRLAEDMAPASVNREFAVLRAALGYAVDKGRIRRHQPVPLRKGAAVGKMWLRPEQITTFLEAAKKYPATYLFIRLALATAQRKEAILSLRKDQVDWEQGVIWFSDHGLSHGARRKGRGDVPISGGLRDILQQHKNDSPYVIVSERGCRLRDLNREHWREIVTAAGAPELTPHNLRHTVATNLLRAGHTIYDVSKILGHANTLITERVYAKHQPSHLAGIVGSLDTLVGA